MSNDEAATLSDLATTSAITVEPLLVLAIILVAGVSGGAIARRFNVPSITGNIVAGALLGLTFFHNVDVATMLYPLSTFAISLIAVTAGGHLSYRRIHNALRRIFLITVSEVALSFVFVFIAIRFMGQAWPIALILAALSTSTAPATTMAIIQEDRAKGPFVKTLLSSVSLDSAFCILLFEFAHGVLISYFDPSHPDSAVITGLRQSTWQFIGSSGVGVVLGLITPKLIGGRRLSGFSGMLVAVLFAAGLSSYLGFSPLLTCLAYGAYLGNSSRENERQLVALEPVEPLLYAAFFTVAGVALHFDLLLHGGVLFAVYMLARAFGKGVGAYLGAVLSRCTPRIRNSIPFGYVPQAGVVLGLVVILQADPRIPHEFSNLIVTLVLASVTLNEIIGPFFTRYSLQSARESGLDRPRLVEFLQEEFVLTDLKAKDKWDALRKLTDFYARTHRLRPKQRDIVYETIEKREQEFSTAIGLRTALPHGIMESGTAIEGVLAICPDGVDFDAPDGKAVKLLVLIVTPKDHEQRHLEVLASLSSMISHEQVRKRLIAATDANDAWEILEDEESRGFNYFLEGNDLDSTDS